MTDDESRGVPKIVGTGWAVPSKIRLNDDPIFDWLHAHQPPGSNLFQGYRDRRVLSDHESLETILVPAARRAVEASGIDPKEIDLVLGTASVSPYESPDTLAKLPASLGLSPRGLTIPLYDDFSNFNSGLLIADAMIRAGRARHALVACASSWTRFVDYHTPQAVSAADGAGAAVVSRTTRPGFEIVDTETITDASWFGSMYMAGDLVPGSDPPLFTSPTFHITERGQQGFSVFGMNAPPEAANALLARNGLKGGDVSLVSHQASSVLLDAWKAAIDPHQYLQTLVEFANVTVANIPLSLAYLYERIERDHVVLLAIGTEMHTNALLLRRTA